jgi:hypothetical protein
MKRDLGGRQGERTSLHEKSIKKHNLNKETGKGSKMCADFLNKKGSDNNPMIYP